MGSSDEPTNFNDIDREGVDSRATLLFASMLFQCGKESFSKWRYTCSMFMAFSVHRVDLSAVLMQTKRWVGPPFINFIKYEAYANPSSVYYGL